MTINRRKKNSRFRGSHTHGWGAKKKRRGTGHRGGKGMAGTGKRADTKKPSIWKERYFGKFGFIKKGQDKNIKAINLAVIDEKFDRWLSSNLITKEGDCYMIDLPKIGFNKLLSNGRIRHKVKIKVKYASKGSIEKIKKSGGDVILESGQAEG